MPRTVELSDDAYAVLCGLVQPEDDVHHVGIFGPFEELRAKFPLADFRKRAEGDPEFYDEDAGF